MVDMKKKATDILEDYSNSYSQVDLETLTRFLEQIKAEAIKEFDDRLKKLYETYPEDEEASALYLINKINEIVKEMKGNNDE